MVHLQKKQDLPHQNTFFFVRKPFFFSFWEGDSSIGQETLVHGCLTTGHSYEAKLSDPEIGQLVDGWRCSAMG
jgi:hypothetical protein